MSLYLEHITQRFGQTLALNDIDLEIRNGEFLAILGPSGCGKTTLLRAIGGFAKPTEGKIRMDDVIYSGNGKMVPVEQRDLGMVFQSFALWPNMTVRQHVEFPMKSPKQKHLTEAQKKEAVDAAIENMGLKPYEDRYPGELSGGQRQRVSLARAIVGKPSILLMDEPLSALDAELKISMRRVIQDVHRMTGATIIYVTHDQIEAMTVGQRIALMHEGKMQMLDTPANVYNRPANVFTAKFIGSPSMNIVEASYTRGTLVIGRQVVWLPDMWSGLASRNESGRLFLGIRPEHMILHRRRQENTLEGTVKYVEDYGNRYGVYVQVDNMEIIAVSEGDVPAPGESVYIQPDFDRIHLFDRATQVSLGYPEQLRAAREPYILQKGASKKGENGHGFAHQYQYV